MLTQGQIMSDKNKQDQLAYCVEMEVQNAFYFTMNRGRKSE